MKIKSIDVDYSESTLPESTIEKMCNEATADLLNIEEVTQRKISKYIGKIAILPGKMKASDKCIKVALQERGDYKTAIVTQNNVQAFYSKLSPDKVLIEMFEKMLNPFQHWAFAHEIGHAYHELFVDESLKRKIKKKFEDFGDHLVEKILSREYPREAAEKLCTSYSFLNSRMPRPGAKVCYPGYVGKVYHVRKYTATEAAFHRVNKITNSILSKFGIPPPKMIRLYQFQENEDELFAEMFRMYFDSPKELEDKGLFEFADDIICKRKI